MEPLFVGITEAKARMEDLIIRAEAGQSVIITRHRKPVIRLELASPIGEEAGLPQNSNQFNSAADDVR